LPKPTLTHNTTIARTSKIKSTRFCSLSSRYGQVISVRKSAGSEYADEPRNNKRKFTMEPCVKTRRMRLLLILLAALVLTLQTAFAQDNTEKTSGNVHAEIRKNLDTSISRMKGPNSRVENKDADLLNELLQPDAANKTEQTSKEESCDRNVCTSDKVQKKVGKVEKVLEK
jgi:hypothetical protein